MELLETFLSVVTVFLNFEFQIQEIHFTMLELIIFMGIVSLLCLFIHEFFHKR